MTEWRLARRVPFFRLPNNAATDSVLQHMAQLQPDIIITTPAGRERVQSHAEMPTCIEVAAGNGCAFHIASSPCGIKMRDNRTAALSVAVVRHDAQLDLQTPGAGEGCNSVGHRKGADAVSAALRAAKQCAVDDPVCVVSTSGSSAVPKHVVLGATALLHRLAWHENSAYGEAGSCRKGNGAGSDASGCQMPVTCESVVAASSSVAFVDSIWQLLAPMVYGVPLHMHRVSLMHVCIHESMPALACSMS